MADTYIEPLGLDPITDIGVNDQIIVTHQDGKTERLPGLAFFEAAATCSTAAANEQKNVTITDYEGSKLPSGARINITFSNGNTYGDVSGSTKTWPKLSIRNKSNAVIATLDVCDSRGHEAGKGCWNAGDMMIFKCVGNKALIQNSDVRQVSSDYIIYADGSNVYNKQSVDSSLLKFASIKLGEFGHASNNYDWFYKISGLLSSDSSNMTPFVKLYVSTTWSSVMSIFIHGYNNSYFKSVMAKMENSNFRNNSTFEIRYDSENIYVKLKKDTSKQAFPHRELFVMDMFNGTVASRVSIEQLRDCSEFETATPVTIE